MYGSVLALHLPIAGLVSPSSSLLSFSHSQAPCWRLEPLLGANVFLSVLQKPHRLIFEKVFKIATSHLGVMRKLRHTRVTRSKTACTGSGMALEYPRLLHFLPFILVWIRQIHVEECHGVRGLRSYCLCAVPIHPVESQCSLLTEAELGLEPGSQPLTAPRECELIRMPIRLLFSHWPCKMLSPKYLDLSGNIWTP